MPTSMPAMATVITGTRTSSSSVRNTPGHQPGVFSLSAWNASGNGRGIGQVLVFVGGVAPHVPSGVSGVRRLVVGHRRLRTVDRYVEAAAVTAVVVLGYLFSVVIPAVRIRASSSVGPPARRLTATPRCAPRTIRAAN